jgi:diguanylate cyclase (GGDEF)-like protein/PAS domain S-box-containing protein
LTGHWPTAPSVHGLLVLDRESVVLSGNQAAADLFGYAPTELVGHKVGRFVPGLCRPARAAAATLVPSRDGDGALRVAGRNRNGDTLALACELNPISAASGRLVVAVLRELDRANSGPVRRPVLAQHDPLTGLPNRHLLLDRLALLLATARGTGPPCGLVLVDLDHFKDVNSSLGHGIGDLLIRRVAERLGGIVGGDGMVAYLGADEFAVLVPQVAAAGDVLRLAQRLVEGLKGPVTLTDEAIYCSASAGVALSPEEGCDAAELVRRADLALHLAKRSGRSAVRLCDARLLTEAEARKALERELREGLERDEFELAFQPQYDLPTRRIVGVEALLRWRHARRGLLLPGEFIPIAEKSGLISLIGRKVLLMACHQACTWRAMGWPLTVAINLSAAELRSRHSPPAIAQTLDRYGLEARLLEIELTETVFLEALDKGAAAFFDDLAARGVGLAIDDFGVGYSALGYLKRLPAKKIKIDRSFIRDLGRNPQDETFVAAIVTLGKSLGKTVVAEGVETEEQLAFLERVGCDEAQGFLFAAPKTAAEITDMLRSSPREVRRSDALVPR